MVGKLSTLLILGASALRFASAFTNGTLLPSYICGPSASGKSKDGYPKAVSTLLPYLVLGTPTDMYNIFPPGNNTVVTIAAQCATQANMQAMAPSAQNILGAVHHGNSTQDANGNPVSGSFLTGVVPPVWIAPLAADPILGVVNNGNANNYVITPGALHSFTIASHCPAPDIRGYNNPNVQIRGFVGYAIDTGTGQRVGSWVNVGPTLQNWYACNPASNASASVGIVHNQLVSTTSNLANLTWQAPATISGLIQFIGAGISDCGYGAYFITYNVSGSNQVAPSITAQGFNPNKSGVTSATLTYKTVGSADLPQTIGNAANSPNQPASVYASTTTTTTNTYSAGAVAGIAIGCAIVGAVIVGGIMFLVGRNSASRTGKAQLLL